jgi:hypothetical protein
MYLDAHTQGGAGTPAPTNPLPEDLLLSGAHPVEPRDWEAVAGHPCVHALSGGCILIPEPVSPSISLPEPPNHKV